jgi:hypothetical protein
MARKITIEILGIDWYIEDKELLGKDDDSEDSLYFANWSCYKNKIVHLHDCITVKIEDSILENKMFLEVCNFTHDKTNFTGTFIDALNYIKEQIHE